MSGIQSPDLLNYFRRIQIDDLNPDLAEIDPTVLSPVYPFDPTWLGLDPVVAVTYGTPINGTTVTLPDVDADSGGFPGTDPLLSNNRYYHNIRVFLAGGTVSPITVSFQYTYGATNQGIFTRDQTNPGRGFYGPFFVPAGAELQCVTETNGGAGDTINVGWIGFQALPGVPLPTIQPIQMSEFT